jgi:hypothetical protein
MNKQLERDLLCSIQSLKAAQLVNVLGHYELLTGAQCEKTLLSKNKDYSEKGMSLECEITIRGQSGKGYGRN